jgi:tetratricopeptide (TPR) repeat protein
MRAAPLLTCLWPGLSRLWLRGQWPGLLWAAAFGVLLNGALVASFVWPELLGPNWNTGIWLTVVIVWAASAWRSCRILSELGDQPSRSADELFLQAQSEYLKGHWFEAESLLGRLLTHKPRDAEANLMLATLYRHTRRKEQAEQQLGSLQRLDSAARWHLEIRRERQQLDGMTEDEKAGGRNEPDSTAATESPVSLSEAA